MKAYDKRIRSIKAYAKELEMKWDGVQTVLERWNPVERYSRKRRLFDPKKTNDRLKQRMSKCSQVIFSKYDQEGLIMVVLTHLDGRFQLVECLVPFHEDYDFNSPIGQGQLSCAKSKVYISRHAIERWLERNDSYNVKEALMCLAGTAAVMDDNLYYITNVNDRIMSEKDEFQMPCFNGGMVFFKTTNIDAECAVDREWTLVSYISEDMVKHWNTDDMRDSVRQYLREEREK